MARPSPRRALNSLSFKLGFAFALVVLAAVGCMGGYAYVQGRRNALQRELTELQTQSKELAARIDRSLAAGKGLVDHLACTRNVEDYLALDRTRYRQDSFQEWLDLQVVEAKGLSTVFLLSPRGRCLASSDRSFVGHDFSYRPYFQEAAAGQFAASDWMIGTLTRSPRIFSAAPVRLRGRIVGVLVTEFQVDDVTEAISATGVNGRTAVAINAQGIALAASRPGIEYHALLPLAPGIRAELRRTRQFQDRDIPADPLSQEYAAAFHRALDTGLPQTVAFRLGTSPRWGVLSPLTERPWVASVAVYEAEVLLPVHRAMVHTLLVGLATTLGAFGMAFGLRRWLLEPIHRLADAMGRFGAGDATVRAPVHTRDERGQLALAFNAMADALQAHRERLEELVKARTRELSRSESQYRSLAQRLELATASGSLGIWDRNLLDGTEFWNDRMYGIYGLERRASDPDYAFWLRNILHPEDRQATEAAIQAAIRGGQPYDLAFRVILASGEVRHVKSDGQVVRDAEGRPVRIIGINRDRTREVEAEAERRQLQAELQHAEKLDSIGSLAGGVAHDLNNVLAAILGMASVLRSGCPDGDPRAMPLDTITSACTRGRDVVRSLLTFARKDLEARGPVDLNGLAREVLQLLSCTTLSRVRTSTEFQEPLGLIEGDAGGLGHALINLCVNAVDAMPQGGALTVRTRQTAAGGVELSIRDTGEGMSPEVARRAIEPFFTTKPVGKGTGLGLAMVYGTVKAHRGTFEIRSEPGLGTEVILGFPPWPGKPARGPASGPPARLRILLVDDEAEVRQAFGPMLETLGHDVETAGSGLEALELIQDGLRVDLVILDLDMPGLSGAHTLPRLLALRPGLAVMLATGRGDDPIGPLLAGRPNLSGLDKPFDLEQVRVRLEAIGTAPPRQ
jgi:C4-dicarboxylate-specific signal transduction histidine kinase